MKCLFDEAHQRALIDEVHVAAKHQNFRVHFVATEPTHIHVLVSWHEDERAFEKLRVGNSAIALTQTQQGVWTARSG